MARGTSRVLPLVVPVQYQTIDLRLRNGITQMGEGCPMMATFMSPPRR
jgi:hypothetical protein